MDMILILVVMLLILLLKGFFSGSEIALVNSDKIRLRHKTKQGNRGARLALKLLQTPDVLLSTTLVGTNICTVVLTTIGWSAWVGRFLMDNTRRQFMTLSFCRNIKDWE